MPASYGQLPPAPTGADIGEPIRTYEIVPPELPIPLELPAEFPTELPAEPAEVPEYETTEARR